MRSPDQRTPLRQESLPQQKERSPATAAGVGARAVCGGHTDADVTRGGREALPLDYLYEDADRGQAIHGSGLRIVHGQEQHIVSFAT